MSAQILLVDLAMEKDSLSRYEFVNPIAAALKNSGCISRTQHFSELEGNEHEDYAKIILCGTAIKDNAYAEHLESFSWIRHCKKPVLGICAGMQVIGASFGGKIVPQPAIGLEKIEITANSPLLGEPREIEGYQLHNFAVTLPDEFLLLAGSPISPVAFVHGQRPIYGIIFHPEVRNRWILHRFANM